MSRTLTRFVVAHPRLIILAVALTTVALGCGLLRGLELDVAPLTFVRAASVERTQFETARGDFGPDDYLVIAVVCDDVFAPANLTKLRALHQQIEKLPGVREVVSLINAPYARATDDGASLETLLPGSFADAARIAEARQVATSDELYRGNLLSADARTAALNVLFQLEASTMRRHELTAQIYALTHNAGFTAAYFAGSPFSQWRGTQATRNDLQLFLPLTLVLIALLLWLCFRSLVAVVLPMLTIAIGLVWLFGVMAYVGAHFTLLALMLPTVMLAIGCSYLIHVFNQIGIEYGDGATERPSDGSIERALAFIALPVVVSALTIIAGFLSLAFTKIPAIRATAIFAALGATLTMLLSLTFVPAVLLLLNRRAIRFRVGLTGGLVRLLEITGRWATAQQKLLYVLTALIVLGSIIGLTRIVIDIDYLHFFKPKAETSVSLDEIGRRLSGAVTFELIIEGDRPDAIVRPDVLRRIEQLQSYAATQRAWDRQQRPSGIDKTLSVADFVKHLNRAFHGGKPEFNAIPQDEAIVTELLSDRAAMRAFLTEDGRKARVLVRSNLFASQAMAAVIHRVEARGRELLPEFRVFATGTFVLLNRTSDGIAREQTVSITLALVTIFVVLSLLFRSARVGFTALVPNLIPVLFFFGFMGWRGIPLNLTTSLVASVVLGLAVDNAVQFIVRFRRVQATQPDLRQAIIESMRLSGRPTIYANVALAATFAIFAVSNFEPISSFGLLSAVTILGCLVEDLALLPARLTSPLFRAK